MNDRSNGLVNHHQSNLSLGYSGDPLRVLRDGKDSLISKQIQGLSRAETAIKKQLAFNSIQDGENVLKAVPIYHQESHQESRTITMPYIHGESGPEIVLSGKTEVPGALNRLLSMYISRSLAASRILRFDSQPLFLKLLSIKQKSDSYWAPYILELESRVKTEQTELFLPIGPCHGDLTLSNIILTGNSFYLIDFIPSTYESILSDMAKINQDLLYCWSTRLCDKTSINNSRIFSNHAYPGILRMTASTYKKVFSYIEILNWMRIIPYISDDTTSKHVDLVLNRLLSAQSD